MTGPFVILTRPRPDSMELVNDVKAAGAEPFIEPMFEIRETAEKLTQTLLGEAQALIFTSKNAVRVAGAYIADRIHPLYCVGDATAEQARTEGWTDVYSAGGDVGDLHALLEKMLADGYLSADKPLLYPSGAEISQDLNIPGMNITRVPVYKTIMAPSLSEALQSALKNGQVKVVVFFSARTAAHFESLVEKAGCTSDFSAIKALCISDSVVQSLTKIDWADVQAAERPDQQNMMELLNDVCVSL